MSENRRVYAPTDIYVNGNKDWYYDRECTNFVKEIDSLDMTNSVFCFSCKMTEKCTSGNCGHAVMIDNPRYFGPGSSFRRSSNRCIDFTKHIIFVNF